MVSRYKFTCALTGLCCLTSDGADIVDAAHIEPWAAQPIFFHSAFFILHSALNRVVLAPHRFTESGPEALRLQPYAGRLLRFADGVTLRPNAEYFGRHRAFHGFRSE